jgi:hypothetical protein
MMHCALNESAEPTLMPVTVVRAFVALSDVVA